MSSPASQVTPEEPIRFVKSFLATALLVTTSKVLKRSGRAAAAALLGLGASLASPTYGQVISEFSIPSGLRPGRITAGPDALWFVEDSGSPPSIGRISTAGAITEFRVPAKNGVDGYAIAAGADGNLWLTEGDPDGGQVSAIGRLTASGAFMEFPLHSTLEDPCDITAGPDGNVWFTECNINGNAIGRITPAGDITEFRRQTGGFGYYTLRIFAGLDGNLWFTAMPGSIGRISTSGVITEFPVAGVGAIAADSTGTAWFTTPSGVGSISRTGVVTQFPLPSSPGGITVGADGNVWFTERSSNVGTISPSGVISEFRVSAPPRDITTGPDGNIWFLEPSVNRIGRITTVGIVAEFEVPTPLSTPWGLTTGPDGALWFSEEGSSKIGRITTGPIGGGTGDNWVVPSTAHSMGADGSFWTSDLTVFNRSSSATTITLRFLGHDADGKDGPQKTFELSPYETITYRDVLSSAFGFANGWGALQVLSDSGPLAVRSRTSTPSGNGMVGDGLPGVRLSDFFTSQTAPSPVLVGLREDDEFRSNLVLVNGSAIPAAIVVSVSDGSGASVGSMTYTIPPLGSIQDARFLLRPEFGGQSRTDATATLSTATLGASFTAVAMVIDNVTNAPSVVLPQ